MTWKELTRI